MPKENHRHVLQLSLLMDVLMLHWTDRQDVFVGGNMFVYFSPDQVLTEDFRGPDLFVVQGVSRRDRKSWVVWQEGKAPDVVIELLSESTAHRDRTEKKLIYQDRLRVPEYFWYDPYTAELAGFALHDGVYEPIEVDSEGNLPCRQLGLRLVRWEGSFGGVEATWLRWASADGSMLPTGEVEHQRAELEHQRAERAEQRIAELEARLARIEEQHRLPGETG